MSYVERAGRELGVWESDPNDWTPDKVTKLYRLLIENLNIIRKEVHVELRVLCGRLI